MINKIENELKIAKKLLDKHERFVNLKSIVHSIDKHIKTIDAPSQKYDLYFGTVSLVVGQGFEKDECRLPYELSKEIKELITSYIERYYKEFNDDVKQKISENVD